MLTDREREILHLLVEDHTQKEISEKLFISPHTVDTTLRNSTPSCRSIPAAALSSKRSGSGCCQE
jgi:FixJ family two-component response regulator